METISMAALMRAKALLDEQQVPPAVWVWLPDMAEAVKLDDLARERERLGLPPVEPEPQPLNMKTFSGTED